MSKKSVFCIATSRDQADQIVDQLKTANFSKIEPGWDKAQVRRLLGLPAKTMRYALKNEEIWDWRFAETSESKLFSVTFDADGRVKATAIAVDDPHLGK